jgi:Tfp pilus assembly protein PilN
MTAMWASTGSTIDDQKAELAQIEQDAALVRARAEAQQAPGAVQQTRLARTEVVRALASARRDWAETLDAFSRTLPADVDLTTLSATTVPASAGTVPGETAAGPTLTFSGCAPSQRDVAKLMPRLRSMADVVDVQLVSSSTAPDAAAGDAECGGATFSMNLELEPNAPLAAAAAPATGTVPATAPPATTPPATGAVPPAGAPAPVPPASQTTPATATTAVPGTPTSGGTQ